MANAGYRNSEAKSVRSDRKKGSSSHKRSIENHCRNVTKDSRDLGALMMMTEQRISDISRM